MERIEQARQALTRAKDCIELGADDAAKSLIDAALSALEAEGGTEMKVKALEWIDGPGRRQEANTILGRYDVTTGGGYWYPHVPGTHGPIDYTLRTPEAAKAAAQADYERRIRSALGGNHAE